MGRAIYRFGLLHTNVSTSGDAPEHARGDNPRPHLTLLVHDPCFSIL